MNDSPPKDVTAPLSYETPNVGKGIPRGCIGLALSLSAIILAGYGLWLANYGGAEPEVCVMYLVPSAALTLFTTPYLWATNLKPRTKPDFQAIAWGVTILPTAFWIIIFGILKFRK